MPCNIHPVLPQQLGDKFDRVVIRSKVIKDHLLNKLGSYIPRYSLKAFLSLKKKILSVFNHIRRMGMAAILLDGAISFELLSIDRRQNVPSEI